MCFLAQSPLALLLIMKSRSAPSQLSEMKVTRICLSPEVYRAARNLGLNISQLCEQRLREEIHARAESDWNGRHAEFLKAYNQQLEQDGLALEEWRAF